MNRQTTPPQTNPPYTNGHYETPLELSGVSLHRPPPIRKPTVFPADLPVRGFGPLLYALHRFHLSGMPVARYMAMLWIAIALLAAVNVLPGRWITFSVALLLLVGQIVMGEHIRQRSYVTFTASPTPLLQGKPLEPTDKLPIYATGLLNVEGRYRHYSALPGFYRTFATNEHAILCRVPQRNWLTVTSWPPDEVGMWYAFVKPMDIDQLAWGTLQFGATSQPALAIRYRLELPPGPRRKKTEIRPETIYLSTPELKDAQRLYVDLLNNLPAAVIAASFSDSN